LTKIKKKKKKMSTNKRFGSPMEGEKAKEMRSELSQASFSDDSTLDNSSVAGKTVGQDLEDQHAEVTGLFKGSNEGAWRESFVVDVLEIDGQKFMGSLTRKEMSSSIYTKALGLRPENLHGFVPGYRGHPTIKYRLKEKINVDLDLQGKSLFTFERVEKVGSETLVHTFKCEIAGIREPVDTSDGNLEARRKSRYTWIKVEGAEYELPKEEIVAWLQKFGNPVSELTEDKERDSSDSDDNEYYNGIYSIKMDLQTKPPQFLPISGKKIKIYYKGIAKRCVRCLETGHLKKDCTSARKDWMEYVSDLMFDTGFDLIMLGDAKKYLEKWRLENKEKTDAMISHCKTRNEEKALEEAKKLERQDALRVEVQNISKILHNQSLASGQKLPLTAQTEFSSLNTTPTIAMPVEDEEKAWMSLGESSQSNQTAGTSADAERKKRKYTKKNQKNQIVDGSGPNKNKQ
jgi:hypothetical protein